MITRFKANAFTVFTDIDIAFSPGINIIVGSNGTGKTHLMKAVYSACSTISPKVDRSIDMKINGVFRPNHIGRLVHRVIGRARGSFTVFRREENESKERYIKLTISTLGKTDIEQRQWKGNDSLEVTFIPVKDMLANAPGFRSLFSKRELEYEEVYVDIIDKAFLPVTRGKMSAEREKLLKLLQTAIDGKIIDKNETFYLKNRTGELEFPLLAEGYRKLGLLYRLIQNDSLVHGSILFWDEPEANLNPKLAESVVKMLLELQRMGVQIFIATHDYVLLKCFEQASSMDDHILYHTLFKSENGEIKHSSTSKMEDLYPNAIDDAYGKLLDNEIAKGLTI